MGDGAKIIGAMGIAAVAGTGVHALSTVSHIYNLNTVSHVAQIAHGAAEVQIGKALARVAETSTGHAGASLGDLPRRSRGRTHPEGRYPSMIWGARRRKSKLLYRLGRRMFGFPWMRRRDTTLLMQFQYDLLNRAPTWSTSCRLRILLT